MRALCYDALRQGVAYLREHKGQCIVKKETDRVVDFLVDAGKQEVTEGLTLQSAWFRIDRAAKVISGILFTFDNGKTMLIKMTHADASVPGATGPVPTLTRATVKQTALQDPEGKIELPPQLTVTYTGYRFYAQ